MAVDVGDLYRCNFTLKSPDNALVNATTMTLTITLPDNTTTVITPVAPMSTGTYQYDYTTVQAGRHQARWVGTGTNPGAYVEAFDVRPASINYLVSLQDAKTKLNISTTTNADPLDEEIRSYLEAVTGVVERHLGQAVVRRSFTEERTATNGCVVLSWPPVVSITSMALVDGTYTWDINTLHVSPTGVVYSPLGIGPYGTVTVTYTAGMPVVPKEYSLAGLIILQHLWETERGSSGGPRPGGLEDSMTLGLGRMGFAIPNRALELLGAGLPGIA